jgi:hypothetical protein
MECRVEDLFNLRRTDVREPRWAWPPEHEPCRYWAAEVGGSECLYPVAATPMGVIPHDGTYRNGFCSGVGRADPRRTLMMACCDPAVGLLAAELARTADVRLIALERTSRTSLTLLGQGLVHVAGVHMASAEQPAGNAGVVRSELGLGYCLLRAARWEEGIAVAPSRPSHRSVRHCVRAWSGLAGSAGPERGSALTSCSGLGERPPGVWRRIIEASPRR